MGSCGLPCFSYRLYFFLFTLEADWGCTCVFQGWGEDHNTTWYMCALMRRSVEVGMYSEFWTRIQCKWFSGGSFSLSPFVRDLDALESCSGLLIGQFVFVRESKTNGSWCGLSSLTCFDLYMHLIQIDPEIRTWILVWIQDKSWQSLDSMCVDIVVVTECLVMSARACVRACMNAFGSNTTLFGLSCPHWWIWVCTWIQHTWILRFRPHGQMRVCTWIRY